MNKKKILLFLLSFLCFPIYGRALSVDKNSIILEPLKEDSIGIYANVEEEVSNVSFTLVYSTYDISANFVVNENYTDSSPNSITHNIVLDKPTSGTIKLGEISIGVIENPTDTSATINIYNGKAINDTNEITLDSQVINVKINNNTKFETTDNEEKDDENNNKKLLKEIKSDLVSINLIEGVYEYEVDIDSDILELDLEPIAIDNTYKIDISSQKLSEIEDNKVIIKVSDNKDKTEEYVIKLNIKEKVVNEDISIENNNYNSKWITVVVISAVILVLGLILLKKNS